MEWVQKTNAYNKAMFDSEIMISKIETKGNNARVFFKFMKNSIYKIVKTQDFITLARDKSRIYFKETDPCYGFKIADYGYKTKCFKVREDLFPIKNDELGEYNLEYDTQLGLHYIDINRKLKKELDWKGRIK